LKRVIQRRLQDPLAQLILEGKVMDGSKVKVSVGKNGLTVNGVEFATADDDLETEHSPQTSRAVH
jgi:ATP-dependent Clp protease ATP-binding subunit ClpB